MTTITQDPNDRYTLLMEDFRRERGVHGRAGRLRCLFWGLFIGMMRLLASRTEQRRAGTLPDTAAAAAREQPEMPSEITASVAEAPCEMPVVEQAATLPPPRRARVRKLKNSSGPALAQPRHADDGCWPQWRGVGLVRTIEVGFLRLDSKKWVCGGRDKCVHFVTI